MRLFTMVRVTPETSQGAPICVLGMSRSGTSLTTRIVGLLGIDLGPEDGMLEYAPDNPSGFWEQRAIMDLNDELLKACGGTWWDPPTFSPGWESSRELEPLRLRAASILEQHFDRDSRFAWKDPRTCLTLPFWQQLIGEMDYVVCFRNPLDVAGSLVRRNPTVHSLQDSLQLWLRHGADALRHTAGHRRLIVFHEDWFSGSGAQLSRLAEFVVGDEAAAPKTFQADVHAFTEDALWHHRTSDAELASDDRIPAEVRLFWLALRAAIPGGEDGAIPAVLPALLESSVQRAEQTTALEARTADLEALGQTLAQTNADLAALRQTLTAAELRNAETAQELERHRGYLRSIEASLSWRLTAPLRAAKRGTRAR